MIRRNVVLAMCACVGLLAWAVPATAAGRGAPKAEWRFDAWPVRLSFEVKAAGAEQTDRPVEVAVNFTEALATLGRQVAFEETSLRLVEVDAQGRVTDDAIPFQFDRADDYDDSVRARGTVIFILKGTTAADATRRFHLYFNVGGSLVVPLGMDPLIGMAERVPYRGQESVKIVTPLATYFYHRMGGALAAMEDLDGQDWIGYRPVSGPGGGLRGIPNLAMPDNVFRPGGTKCETTIARHGPVKITLASRSDDRRWACTWEFFPKMARLTVLKADHPYWFLYEGTPGGAFDAEKSTCIRSPGRQSRLGEAWETNLQAPRWVCFTAPEGKRGLLLLHHEPDAVADSYRAVDGQMTSFGFGRQGVDPMMTRLPARFSMALVEDASPAALKKAVDALYQAPEITLGQPEVKPKAE